MSVATASSGADDGPRITLRSPGDLVAATPYLLRFHPAESLVVLGFRQRTYVGATRCDLSVLAGSLSKVDYDTLLDPAVSQGATTVAVLGYGPAAAADPAVTAMCAAADRRGLELKDALRVEAGRWWSYLCRDPQCCPPEGTPFDVAGSEVVTRCVVAGLTALPSRAELERQVAPVEGPARAVIGRATDHARQRFSRLLASCAGDSKQQWTQRVLAEGTVALAAATERYASGGVLEADELAWLTVLLTSLDVRDLAWQQITADEPYLSMWADLTRRADQSLVVAPACLLAFTAWRFGEPVLAGLALDRALQIDPGYPMAGLLSAGLQQGPPPPEFDDWGTAAWSREVEQAQCWPDPPGTAPRRRAGRKSRRQRRGRGPSDAGSNGDQAA